ncbi:MAG TPA: cobalamin-dependent protein [Candidatus Lokiarchaeia archaeon]|nr:cobalamin-dependent protein [Candidatus Lokiarchaeia archaeon]
MVDLSLIEKIASAIVDGDSASAVSLANQAVADNMDLNDVILRGLNQGMHVVGELYEKREYFLPDIIVSADAIYDTLEVFKPYLKRDQSYKATVVIGVVRGDIHDIGKNVTKIFFETTGYKVVDCGRNVPAEQFIEAVETNDAQVLALSTLMSPTLASIHDVVTLLDQHGLREKVIVIVGGAATSEEFAREEGVIYVKDGIAAISLLDERFGGEKFNLPGDDEL